MSEPGVAAARSPVRSWFGKKQSPGGSPSIPPVAPDHSTGIDLPPSHGLREMDASVDALAYTLIGVLAQRLVPTLCPHCKTPDTRDEVARELDQAWLEGLAKAPMRRTDGGCQSCGGTGIRGRRMVYEIMEGDKIRPLVEANAPISKIHDAGIQPGQSMWARSLLLVAAGLVDMDELRDRVERS